MRVAGCARNARDSIMTRSSCIINEMKNITVTLDEETAAWARVYAAGQNKSLSRFLGELLERTMRESREYDDAMRQYLSKKPSRLNREGAPNPGREELHERTHLR
jgi:hypothetical protein